MHTAEKRIAWITGGGSGIGRALALKLAADGWQVAISGRRPEPLRETAAAVPQRVRAYPLDVGEVEAVRQTAARIEAELGSITLAVFSAGIGQIVKLDSFEPEIFAEHMRINYLGAVNGIAAVLPGMRARQSGHIVIVASLAGYRGTPQGYAYGPTKAALINLAESLKPSLEREGIGISVCNPGFVATPLTEGARFPLPFLMQPDAAAERLYHGIRKRKFEIAFPTRFVLLLKVFRCLPYAWYFPLMRVFKRRRRKS